MNGKRLVIKLDHLAKSYGLNGRVQFRLLDDPETFRKVKLEMYQLPDEIAADLAAIQAIGVDPDDEMKEMMEAYQ
jgi:hypothetical protein